ncbi:serine--tRNA ligase [Deinococcus sp. Marseille-Q6407]|uniref:serine--tRNA ligase n=1 Tax=Deinococcus sp. Marseille-Q6407 TaxID=2969223 RepID=UPI0021C20B37|nr:serine--tRNA ligase [Deinococcus sp. Marseille-Q6407]
MQDIRFIRENPDVIRKAIADKFLELDLDEVLAADRAVLDVRQQVEALQAERNANAKLVPKASAEDRPALIQKGKDLGQQLSDLEPKLREQEEALRGLLLRVPNIPHPSAPVGPSDEENAELRREGQLPAFDFQPLDHVDLLELQGWADPERVARVSGSRSYLLKGEAARLEMAILTFALDFLAERGLEMLSTSALVRPETLVATGHFPGGEDQVYRLEGEDLLLAGTSEVPLNSLYAGEILAGSDLPLAYAGFSAAFRSEAGSAGRDVRGLIRVHEFRKVEQYVICRPEDGPAWFDKLLANAEGILQALELPYRVVQNSTGDMGLGKHLMMDIETWVPSEEKYRETHSCSYLTDWQARRTGLRFKGEGGKPQFAHTLNNTGIASPRILVPFLENHQQADGTVRIPAALQPYMGGRAVIGKPRR